MALRVGILTISDRVSTGEMVDAGGPAIEGALLAGWEVGARETVPDDRARVAGVLREWADGKQLDVIFTTGGTGLGPRDVTPEATLDVSERLIPGMAEAMRAAGLASTPAAMLSRALAAVRGETVIVNLPGSPKGAAEGVEVVRPVLEHSVATIRGGRH